MLLKIKSEKKCQYCKTKKNVSSWLPAGNICNTCKKNLNNIRKFSLGIPTPRITKEMHLEHRGK